MIKADIYIPLTFVSITHRDRPSCSPNISHGANPFERAKGKERFSRSPIQSRVCRLAYSKCIQQQPVYQEEQNGSKCKKNEEYQ